MINIRSKWLNAEGEALFHYHRFVGRSLRWRVQNRSNLTLAKSEKRPLLWALWHNQVTPFIMFAYRFFDPTTFSLITVGDERGTILGRMAEKMGATPYGIDMGGNPVASGRSLLRIIQAMKRGQQTLLAPDGPDGPAFVPKPGISFLARKTEAVVLPVGIFSATAYRMNRWDRYQVPLPFSRSTIVFGKPILATRKSDEQALEEEISEKLTAVYDQARE